MWGFRLLFLLMEDFDLHFIECGDLDLYFIELGDLDLYFIFVEDQVAWVCKTSITVPIPVVTNIDFDSSSPFTT